MIRFHLDIQINIFIIELLYYCGVGCFFFFWCIIMYYLQLAILTEATFIWSKKH